MKARFWVVSTLSKGIHEVNRVSFSKPTSKDVAEATHLAYCTKIHGTDFSKDADVEACVVEGHFKKPSTE